MGVPDPKYDKKYDWFRQVGLLTGIPMVLMLGPICGYLIGHYVDIFFKIAPWGMVFFTIMGGIAGVREMIGLIQKANKNA